MDDGRSQAGKPDLRGSVWISFSSRTNLNGILKLAWHYAINLMYDRNLGALANMDGPE
jgi:hypothetical protein